MSTAITRVEIRYEQDVVYARQRARLIAELLGFDLTDQTRIGTAVSEICRNAFQYGEGGEVEFGVDAGGEPHAFVVTVRDNGPGIGDLEAILDGRYRSGTGMGRGIAGSRALMDRFEVDTQPGSGTTVVLGKSLPPSAQPLTPETLARISSALAQSKAETPFEALRVQNRELMLALQSLHSKQEELILTNKELDDTNRGVTALYTELDEWAQQLQRANQLKSRFVSHMSHELRSPLNSILSLSQMLLDRVDGELSPEQEKQVQFIRRAGEELSNLVNDLLDLAKAEAGLLAVSVENCPLAEIYGALRGMMRPLLGSKPVNLVFDEPEGIPPLHTDHAKVGQILRNFIANAIKFTDRGEIRVSARLGAHGESVTLSVADTGIGIAAEDQARLFEDYAQVEKDQPRRTRGTGLGLSVARKLAELLGGSVGVESQLGKGSRFFAVIPIRYTPAGAAGATPAAEKPDPTRKPVLVIEDEAATALVYEGYLKGTGYQVLTARSILEARQILERVTPSAIVLDILLPGENAWDFLEALKAGERTRDIPVIIASVLDEVALGRDLGADEYCVKPVEKKWLIDKLNALSRHQRVTKLLMIDDEEMARYMLKRYLADTKHEIIEANDGAAGLSAAETEQPDVILLDVVMPRMNGFEVLRRLKDNPVTRPIPVIVMTAKGLDAKQRATLGAQALAVLSKEAISGDLAQRLLREALRKAEHIIGTRE